MTDMHVRTRIAPSPTGIPHTGTIRTGLYDYLLAKKYGGEFILRLEDTDRRRLMKESVEKVYEVFDILGLERDEDPVKGGPYGPYVQTERLKIYQDHAQTLIDMGAAYYCFCSEERLEQLHKDNPYAKYDRHCRNLSAQEIKQKLESGSPYTIRAKIPETGFTVWKDMVQGKLSLPNTECDDKVLMKTNGIPTYHLAALVDDHLMKISHVLRGVEWMMSTPVHIFLYEAFGWEPPILAHVPLLLGPDRSKLAKRHGAKSAIEYVAEGYLPEAINNFLFYLGYSYKDNSAILTLDEMVDVFDETKLQKQNAIFDIEKLKYLNKEWIKRLDVDELFKRLKNFLPTEWYGQEKFVKSLLPLVRDRMTTLVDFAPAMEYFFVTPEVSKESVLSQSTRSDAEISSWFSQVEKTLSSINDFSSTTIHEELGKAQAASGLTPRDAFMTLRQALSGRPITPPLFDCMAVLGKEESLKRINSIFR